jgi:hypothetical protein
MILKENAVGAARAIGRGDMIAQPFEDGCCLIRRELPYLACDEKNLGLGRLDTDAATAGATGPAFRILSLYDFIYRAVQVCDELDRDVSVRT